MSDGSVDRHAHDPVMGSEVPVNSLQGSRYHSLYLVEFILPGESVTDASLGFKQTSAGMPVRASTEVADP